jgi:glycerate 2-kinase
MVVLIAPDKFKGSLTAPQVCRAIEEALMETRRDFEIISVPMADGGEGTADVLTRLSQGTFRSVMVADPLFRKAEASYGMSGDGKTAFIEMSSASGFSRLRPYEKNPLITTTLGTGELMKHAIDNGAEKIILGIGGSATNDAGMGVAAAFGARFYSSTYKLLQPVGENLRHVQYVDMKEFDSRAKRVTLVALCDVNNPFFGPDGAARVFAPQKGADTAAVAILDEGLMNFWNVIREQFGVDVNFPGAGAGGGLAGGISAFFSTVFQPGVEFISTFALLPEKIKGADVIITGEGKIDKQTLSGKVVKGIASLAEGFRKPVYVICGVNELSLKEAESLHVRHIIPLVNERVTPHEAMKNADQLIKDQVAESLVPLLRGIEFH